MTVPALAVTGLRHRYGPMVAVDGLNLEARAGAVTALLGRNGAGKTTTVECCVGLIRGWEGSITVFGSAPGSDDARGRVGVMLQDGGLPRGVSVRTTLRHLASMSVAPLDADTLLERLGLAGHARTRIERLSGGEARLVALAAAIVGRPDLVFLDEPSAGLDPHARRALWTLVGDLKADGVAIVLTTHDMVEAEKLADDVVIVEHGRAVAHGTVAHLKKAAGLSALEDVFLSVTGSAA